MYLYDFSMIFGSFEIILKIEEDLIDLQHEFIGFSFSFSPFHLKIV